MKRSSMESVVTNRRFLLAASILLIIAGTETVRAGKVDMAAFIKSSPIRYTRDFTLPCPQPLWEHILDNPVFMGLVWRAYGFDPPYMITARPGGFHIVDPGGLEGDLSLIESTRQQRTYIATGVIKNWGIPFSFRGKALFILNHGERDGETIITFSVYGDRGDNRVTNFMLHAISPLLTRLIHRRVARNIRDMGILVSDLQNHPDIVRTKLAYTDQPAFVHFRQSYMSSNRAGAVSE